MSSKPSNPKDAIGCDKLPVHLWPNTATAMGAIGLLNGALKYGRTNWRVAGVRSSIYYDACRRHLDAWFDGEEVDPDDQVPHLAAALACLAIIVDAQAAGKLVDDRAFPSGLRSLVTELTPHVARLKEHHAGREPRHYTLADAQDVTDEAALANIKQSSEQAVQAMHDAMTEAERRNKAQAMLDAAEGKWAHHDGGACPIHASAEVEIIRSGGVRSVGVARKFTWRDDNYMPHQSHMRIVSYRLVS
ncbi:dATP/dGTP diphosphohydrolase domain-containing protein [uncultured Pseudomonas sp.]|uniref:dATP/dGTP diphosphohydrolase domain-containing protein n=1 Tax=uncultured Pseudomonas sp. TaxID=114707 RepID=UPI0025D6C07D|nr:dATP/dGTP diphosphohydrolase domain-containing protein [uncultured Pseudomonas sp.]